MKWNVLTDESQLPGVIERSHVRPQVIYKHSTRCNISSIALRRLEKEPFPETIDFHFLDLLSNRFLSNKIAEQFHVYHESPQVILIHLGEAVYDESHLSIDMQDIIEQTSLLNK